MNLVERTIFTLSIHLTGSCSGHVDQAVTERPSGRMVWGYREKKMLSVFNRLRDSWGNA